MALIFCLLTYTESNIYMEIPMTSFFILVFHYIKKSRFLCSLLLLAGAFTLGSLLGILTGTLSPTKETSASV